ncbi:UNVERIFIED_CONTAM: Chitinase 1 [Siphonaria sp. JEL0065]|nr:Chitinase 1 [Siphonaria sp. JEL0065]
MQLSLIASLLAFTASSVIAQSCTSGAWGCNNNNLSVCQDGAWVTVSACAATQGCRAGPYYDCGGPAGATTTTTTVAKTSSTTTTTTKAGASSTTTTTTKVPVSSTKTTTTTTKAATSTTTTTVPVQTTVATTGTGPSPSPVPTGTPIVNHKYKFTTYWGQNSGKFTNGKNQLRLIEYCNSGQFDIINIAFLSIFGGSSPTKFHLDLDFFGAYDNVFGPADATSVANFLQWGQEVAACQAMGIKILLSLGGGVGSYSVPTGSGKIFAQTLHNSFFGGASSERPFGNVILDGIDWDLEGGGTDQKELVIVNQYLKANNKNMIIGAAPQCPYPDAYMGEAFTAPNAGFSFINVQFYNNYCSLDKQPNFDAWAAALSPLGIPLGVGVPGSGPSAPGGGYVPAATVKTYMKNILASPAQASSLYGVMTWDASSTTVSGMSAGLRSALDTV